MSRASPESFVCEVCGTAIPNPEYKRVIRFCSPSCYHASPQFRDMVSENGKKCVGRQCAWKDAISRSHVGKRRPDMAGEKNWNWRGGGEGRRAEMAKPEYREWRRRVFERDGYACRICGDKNGNGKTVILHAHHLKSWADFPELRYDVDNGRTVCREDHIIGHQLFGY